MHIFIDLEAHQKSKFKKSTNFLSGVCDSYFMQYYVKYTFCGAIRTESATLAISFLRNDQIAD